MTEIQFDRKIFVKTLEAFRTQFQLSKPTVTLQTEESGDRFVLTAIREGASEVKAFGPCRVTGEPVNIEFDMSDLAGAIEAATIASDDLTLLVGEGLWVKENAPLDDTEA
jgi:hypothetical protein